MRQHRLEFAPNRRRIALHLDDEEHMPLTGIERRAVHYDRCVNFGMVL